MNNDEDGDNTDGNKQDKILFEVDRQCRLSLRDIEMSMGQCFVFLVTGPSFLYPFVDYSPRSDRFQWIYLFYDSVSSE